MEASVLNNLYDWFTAYVRSYYTTDKEIQQNIELKEQHTLIVAGHCKNLAKSLHMSEPDAILAEAVGLCHDVGRFKQFTLFRTFKDRCSVNHGVFGVEQLRLEKIDHLINPAEWEILAFAVSCHNARRIPEHPDARFISFAKIVRDADKLDIYRVLPPYSFQDGCSPDLIGQVLKGRQIDYESIRTADDYTLVMISWIYDINFPWTFKEIAGKQYIPSLLRMLPPSPEVSILRQQADNFIAKKINPAIA